MRTVFLAVFTLVACTPSEPGSSTPDAAEPEAQPGQPQTAASPSEAPPACLGLGPGESCRSPDGVAQSESSGPRNVLGSPLQTCSTAPMTGWYRDGACRTGPRDRGVHVVCAEVDAPFLEYTKERGNDLSTPMPQHGFAGLKPGDRWCLCASRWKEALDDGVAPPVVVEATHRKALEWVDVAELRSAQ